MTDLSKGRILVTGGAGFIGSALVWELNRRGFTNIFKKQYAVVNLGRLDKLEGDTFNAAR